VVLHGVSSQLDGCQSLDHPNVHRDPRSGPQRGRGGTPPGCGPLGAPTAFVGHGREVVAYAVWQQLRFPNNSIEPFLLRA
jgi:hypothetical protein